MSELPVIQGPETTIRNVSTYAPHLTDWMNSFGWGQDEPVTINFLHEVLPDGVETGSDGQKWQHWKLGPHQDVTITRDSDNDRREQKFVEVAGEWKIDDGSSSKID